MKELNKTIVILADTPYPRKILQLIIIKNEYWGYEHLYLTNEADKYDVYGSISEELSKGQSSFVFIGNKRQLHLFQSSLCLGTLQWCPLRERYYSSHAKEKKYSNESLDASLIVGLDMLMWQVFHEDSYWYDVARRFGGPMLYSFANFIKTISGEYDEIIFVSRDGYMPMLAYEELGGSNAVYLYCSRMLSTVLGGSNMSDRDSAFAVIDYFKNKGQLGYAGGVIDNRSAWKYYQQNRDEIDKLRKSAYESYSKYVHNKIVDGNVLLVDATTMKYSSQKFLTNVADSNVEGCYYAVILQSHVPHTQYIDRSKQALVWNYVNLAEFFFSSGEAPLLDVTDGGPVFASAYHDSEKYRLEIHSELEKGQLDYVRFAKDILEEYMFDAVALDAWLDVLVKSEHGKEQNRLSGMKWGIDKGHKDYRFLLHNRNQVLYNLEQTIAGLMKR